MDTFHDPFQELFHEQLGLVNYLIVQVDNKLNNELNNVVVDAIGTDVLQQVQQKVEADAFKGRFKDIDESEDFFLLRDGVVGGGGADAAGGTFARSLNRADKLSRGLSLLEYLDISLVEVDIKQNRFD